MSEMADQRIVNWLTTEAAGTKHLVDFGCGTAAYTSRIPASRIRSGVDIHRPYLERCNDDSLDLVQGSMLQWERLELGKFDTAVFVNSLDCVNWKQARRLLKSLIARKHLRKVLVFGRQPAEYPEDTISIADLKELGFRVKVDTGFRHIKSRATGAFFAAFNKRGPKPA